jgi:hypothetical protein
MQGGDQLTTQDVEDSAGTHGLSSMAAYQNELMHPKHLWGRAEILANPSPVPREPGVYAWYFDEIPDGVPTDGCHRVDDW